MYRGILAFCLLSVASYSHAQQVFKCVNGKEVSYQSDPCPGQAVKSWDAAPQAVDPYVEQRLDYIRQEQAQRNAPRRVYGDMGSPRTQGRAIELGRTPGRCEQAKADRKAAYELAGVSRSFDLSSLWDGIVQKACM